MLVKHFCLFITKHDPIIRAAIADTPGAVAAYLAATSACGILLSILVEPPATE
jgi:hypothetical protein